MKQKLFFVLMAMTLALNIFSQGKVKVFNTVLKVKDVIGTTNLATQKWNLVLPEVLVRNEDYYLKTIGSYRDSYNDLDPNSLFNLIDKGSYPLLDEINMRFYEEVVIPDLKTKADVKDREDFKNFCKEWDNSTTFQTRKALLFKDGYLDIGKTIQRGRFSFTKSNFTLSKEVTKKLSATITADIKADLKAQNIEATSSLVNYLSRVVNSATDYSGIMIIAEFEDGYMSRLKNALNGLTKDKIGTDDFSIALKDYASPGSQRAATTGLVIFKITGDIKKSSITEDSLKVELKAKFNSLTDATINKIATTISIGFVSKVTKRFSAEIDNIYIKNYLTSNKVDEIEINKLQSLIE